MALKKEHDMTKGSVPGHLIRFSLPMLLGNALQALYNTVDSIWVGNFLGPSALGAVSVSFPIIFILISLVIGITIATTSLVAQYAGAGNMDRVRDVVNNSVLLLVVMGSVVSVVGILFREEVLRLINTPTEILPMASSYLQVFSTGLIFFFGFNALMAVLRGLGDSKTPLRFLAYAVGLNILLDPLFILGLGPVPKLGVAGAALATVLSQSVAFFLGLRHLARENHLLTLNLRELHFDPELTKQTVKIGLPAGLQLSVVSMGSLVLTALINGFGKTVVAAFGAAVRLDQFAIMPSQSVGLAMSSLSGQNLGAGKEGRIREGVIWGSILAASITLVVTLIALIRPTLLISLFTNDAAVLEVGGRYLRIVGLSYIPLSLMFVSNGVMRGAGDTLPVMIISMVSLWVIRIPLASLLSGHFGLGSDGIWVAVASSSFLSMLLSRAYYATGRWKSKAIVREEPPLAPES